jgi:O-antigen/teichoic acid export membrane protein
VIYSACFPLGLRFRPHRIRKQMVKEISIFSAWVTGSTLSHSALSTFNLIIIEVYRGYADVAVYSVAYTLMIPFTLSTTGLNIILYPKIAENPDPVRHRKLMHYAMAYSISVSLLLLGFYYLFGGWVIRTLFSEGYASAYPPLVILSTGALFINIRTSFSAYFEGSGKPYISTADSVTSAIIGILVSTLLVPHYGILGAAWGMTIGFLMACVVDLIGWIYREK